MILNKKVNSIRNNIGLIVNDVNNKKIINNMKYDDYFKVISIPYFNHVVKRKLEKNKVGTIIICDVNNLYEYNKKYGVEAGNKEILAIIDFIKKVIGNNFKYYLSKMGDEIYIFIPDKSYDNYEYIINLLLEKYNNFNFRKERVTLSLGACDDSSLGFHSRVVEAENRMKEYKQTFKDKETSKFFNVSYCNGFSKLFNDSLKKYRIDLERLNYNQLVTFKNNFEFVLNQIDLNVEKKEKSFFCENQIDLEELYKDDYYNEFGNDFNDNMLDRYVMANLYIKGKFPDTITKSYFDKFGYRKVPKNKDFDVLSISLSGLKKINDLYGYLAGDKEISEIIEYIKQILKSNNIYSYTDIVISNFANLYIIIEKKENNNKLVELINLYDGHITLISDIINIKATKDVKNMIYTSLVSSFNKLDKISLDKKINDIDMYILLIKYLITYIKEYYKVEDEIYLRKMISNILEYSIKGYINKSLNLQ